MLRNLYMLLLACSVQWAFSTPTAHAWNALPPGTLGWRLAGEPGIRGVTVGPIESSLLPDRGYGTPYTEALLTELERLGVNWISITPFGRLANLRDTEIQMDFEAPYEENRLAVKRMIAQAHRHGMRVLVIPHLWVEGSIEINGEKKSWRGEIDPGSDEGWQQYQASYRKFVLAWASDAAEAGADALSVGVECKSWSGRFGGYWTSLISEIRHTFPGLLTYSANWDEAEDVTFWDQLDLIGINAFYPLADHNDATYAEYLSGARRAMSNVHAIARDLAMPVLFVEIGYTTRANAAVEPWLWPDDMQDVVIDEAEQARALAALYEAFLPEEWFTGFFVWRYYADLDDISQEADWGFSPHGKLAEPLMSYAMKQQWGVDPNPWKL